jgi:hypothetical protein
VDKDWRKHTLKAGTIVLASGPAAKAELAAGFRGVAPEVYVGDDCLAAREIYNAFEDAWRAALRM